MSGECCQTEQGRAEQAVTDMKADEAEVSSASSKPSLQNKNPAETENIETDTKQNTVD